MKISYDQATDSLYIHLTDGASMDSDEANDGMVLDYDANGALVGIDVQHASQRVDANDVLQIRLSDKSVVRETSEDWHTNISYAEDGSMVEVVLLDATQKWCTADAPPVRGAPR
jgi:uncharacterized protein YuzE